ncbi:hypothetical protein [Streptomyces olivaceoviridis]|uniref:hypothetical protein n=1 Tax=Streptomyces olivaceoviridis TaxID=1921 RepID=UPI0036F9246D
MFTHEIITTCRTRRRGLLRRGITEQIVITEVEAHTADELGRITRAVLTALDDALPRASVTSKPRPLGLPTQGQ